MTGDPIQDYLAKYGKAGSPQTGGDDPVKTYLAKYQQHQDPATTRHDGTPFVNAPEMDPNYETTADKARGYVQSGLQGATAGLGTRAVAATRAGVGSIMPEFLGGDKGFHPGQNYSRDLGEEQASLSHFRGLHPKASLATELVGSAPLMAATLGMGGAAEGAGFGAKVAQAAKAGGAFGAVQGLGEAQDNSSLGKFAGHAITGGVLGGLGGAFSVPLLEGGAAIGRSLGVPQLASRAAEKLGFDKIANSLGARGVANERLGTTLGEDARAGFVPPARRPTIGAPSPMNLHDVGPSTELMIERNIATRGGPGRTILKQAVDDQSAGMRQGVSDAIESATGRTRGAIAPLQNQLDKAKATSDYVFQTARDATHGKPISPAAQQVYDDVVQTPAGKLADEWARVQKSNRMRAMPTKPGAPVLPGVEPENQERVLALMKERGMPVPTSPDVEVPDYEHLHYMKQKLAQMARFGVENDPGGIVKASAQGAAGLWKSIKNQFPAVWRAADDAAAHEFAVTDAMNSGRNVFRMSSNPAGSPRAAIGKSLDAFEGDLASGTPAERNAAQTGAAGALKSMWEQAPSSVKSPGRVLLRSPERSRQLAVAIPEARNQLDFQRTVGAWDRAQAQGDRLFGNSRTALRGGLAETPGDPGVLRSLAGGNVGSALKQMFGATSKAGDTKLNSQVGEEIAKIVTSPDFRLLDRAQQIEALRKAVGAGFNQVPRLGAYTATQEATRRLFQP